MLESHQTIALPRPESSPVLADVFVNIDRVDQHPDGSLSCITGWIAATDPLTVATVGVRAADGAFVRCNYPFYRPDTQSLIHLAGGRGMIGFNLVAPPEAKVDAAELEFAVVLEGAPDGRRLVFRLRHHGASRETRQFQLREHDLAGSPPAFVKLDQARVSAILEDQLIGELARERHLVVRLDLINKCNLRCVMCHYSNEDFAKRPVQRISPEQFAAYFEPLAPFTRDVVLSCGDEPLMSPHFESILRYITNTDPQVRIRFCTNGMLMTEKIANAIMAARVHLIMFSFDGVTGETLHRIRVGSNYERIIKNIAYLKRLREMAAAPGLRSPQDEARPRFVFNFVMLESNIHEAPLFVDVARRLGADYVDFRHVVEYPYYDIRGEMLEFFKPKFNYYRERIIAAARKASMEVYLPPAYPTELEHDPAGDPPSSLAEFDKLAAGLGLDRIQHAPQGNERTDPDHIRATAAYFCDRPFTEAMIREQKDVYPCPWHKEKMGTLSADTSLSDIFFGEKFQKVRRDMLNPNGAPGCEGCPMKANYLPTAFDGG